MITSSNIIKSAFRVIPHTTIGYRKFVSKTNNEFGVVSETFTDTSTAVAIVQPGIVSSFGGKCIELRDYKEMGLDWSRRYVTVWMQDVGLEPAVNRDGSDEIIHDGKTFTVLQVENWLEYTGYTRCYCAEKKT